MWPRTLRSPRRTSKELRRRIPDVPLPLVAAPARIVILPEHDWIRRVAKMDAVFLGGRRNRRYDSEGLPGADAGVGPGEGKAVR